MNLKSPLLAATMVLTGCEPTSGANQAPVEVVQLAPQIKVVESKRAAIAQVVLASPRPDDQLTITPALPDGSVEHFVFEDWMTKPYDTRPSTGSVKFRF